MTISIRSCPACVTLYRTEGFEDDPRGWLTREATARGLTWLLAHADDGVLWGTVRGGTLETSHDVAPHVAPPLRTSTLQTVRLFAVHAEVLVWCDGDGWRARAIEDTADMEQAGVMQGYDELQILWGDRGEAIPDSEFVIMSDGAQGLRHVVPLLAAAGQHAERPLRLCIRQYLEDDWDGAARVTLSRLVDLTVKENDGGK